jgi:hypothetical protein
MIKYIALAALGLAVAGASWQAPAIAAQITGDDGIVTTIEQSDAAKAEAAKKKKKKAATESSGSEKRGS